MIEIRKTPHADTRSCDVTTAVKETVQLETFYHIQDVGKVLNFFSDKLQQAAQEHDADKLSKFEWFWANFQTNFKERDWLENHYRVNRHHLNAEGGVPTDVDLIDVLEFIADCTSAGVARHGYVTELTLPPELLVTAFQNTVRKLVPKLRVVPEYRLTNYDVSITVHVTSDTPLAAATTVQYVAPIQDVVSVSTTDDSSESVTNDTPPDVLLHKLYNLEKETAAMLREQAKQALLNEENPMYAEDVARLLNCDKSTVYAYGRSRRLFSVKCGRRTRYCRKSVQALLDSGFVVPNLGLRAQKVKKAAAEKAGKPIAEPLALGTLVFASKNAEAKIPQDFVVGFICGYSNAEEYIVSEYKKTNTTGLYKFVEPLTVAEAEQMHAAIQNAFTPHESFIARMRRVRPNEVVVPKQFPRATQRHDETPVG